MSIITESFIENDGNIAPKIERGSVGIGAAAADAVAGVPACVAAGVTALALVGRCTNEVTGAAASVARCTNELTIGGATGMGGCDDLTDITGGGDDTGC